MVYNVSKFWKIELNKRQKYNEKMSTWQYLQKYVYDCKMAKVLASDDIHHTDLFPGVCNKLLPIEGMQYAIAATPDF